MSKAIEKEVNKTIVLGESYYSLGYLKRALSKCGDNARLKVKLCVEKLAEEEKKKDTSLIYYDKLRGFNGGARDLLMAIDNLLDNYSREMVQIDLER